MTFGSRTHMMAGSIERKWNGGVIRMASMEGVICGGAFVRVIAGPAATLAAMVTGDVYGGVARVSGVRAYVTVLEYRAARAAAWACGVYSRDATFVVEPITGTNSQGTPQSKAAQKLARLGKTLEVARMLIAPLDMLIGVATIVPMGILAFGNLIRNAVNRPDPVPPSGPPRTRVRNVGITSQMFSSIKHM